MTSTQVQHDEDFKINAVKYVEEHPDLTIEQCARNLGIGLITLSRWIQQFRTNDGNIPVRGSGKL